MANKLKRAQAIELLATGYSQKQVATKLDLSDSTISHWSGELAFKSAVEERTEAYIQEHRANIRASLALCNSKLFEIINGSKNDQARIKAIELAYKLSGLLDAEPVKRSSGPIRWSFSPVGDTEESEREKAESA